MFFNGEAWVKRSDTNFDISQGSLDGAEASDLIGLYMLDLLNQSLNLNHISFGLYRDDFLAVSSTTGPETERIKKKIIQTFKTEDLQIISKGPASKTINFLDITFNLTDKSFKPYKKLNDQILYVNASSNHPPNILKKWPI